LRGSRGNTNDTISAGAAANIDDTPKVFAGRSGIDLYLAHILFSLNRWDWMISNLTNTGDIRIVPFTRTIISKLPDKDVKVKLFKALNSDILAVKNNPQPGQPLTRTRRYWRSARTRSRWSMIT